MCDHSSDLKIVTLVVIRMAAASGIRCYVTNHPGTSQQPLILHLGWAWRVELAM